MSAGIRSGVTAAATDAATDAATTVFRASTSAAGSSAGGEGISLEQAAAAASRNGIDTRMFDLVHETNPLPFTEGSTGFTGGGAPIRTATGRFVIGLTDNGLSSAANAVNTIAHEVNHIREAIRTGVVPENERPAIWAGNQAERYFR